MWETSKQRLFRTQPRGSMENGIGLLTVGCASSLLLAVGASGAGGGGNGGGAGGEGGGGGSTSFPTVGTQVPLDDSRSKQKTCEAAGVASVLRKQVATW